MGSKDNNSKKDKKDKKAKQAKPTLAASTGQSVPEAVANATVPPKGQRKADQERKH